MDADSADEKEVFILDKLEYVLTLAEERNLTRAANRLFISQPTLTGYINRLESELGIKLFDRTVQPIQVTEAGLIYIEDKKKIQNREQALKYKLEKLKQKSRVFTGGIPPVRSSYDMPRVLSEFIRQYPEVSIHIDNRLEEEIEKDVLTGKVDLAIGMLTTAYPGIHYECIQENKMYLLLSRKSGCVAHLGREEGTFEHPCMLDAGVLNELTMLLPRMGGGHYRMAQVMMERYGIVPANTLRCSDLNLLYQLAGEGVGFLFATPEPFMKAFPEYTDQLAFCVLQNEWQVQKTYIGYLDETPNSEMLQEFIRILKKNQKQENR